MRFPKSASLVVRFYGVLTILALGLAVSWAAFAQAKKPPVRQAPGKAAVQPSQPAAPPAGSSGSNAAGSSAAGAKTAEPPAGGSSTAAAGAGGTDAGGADLGNIDEILQGEEDVLSGSGFSYDPGNRRDPFKSLLAAPDRQEFRGPRPDGVPGLLIDEIDLTGIFHTSRGFVAQVVASNQKKSFLLKEGDQLYDGDVVSINKNEVVFKQVVQDPTALKPFREVVKSLTPAGAG
ncbi:MAG TPA: hypothetical protein VIE43_13530 [Thermoanaerobaculia bacterium]|jgi:hypothetical protein|nr:hypothetical protein [Thermoanaerobaculia bacterium]